MVAIEWLVDLPDSQNNIFLDRTVHRDPDRGAVRHLPSQQRRRLGARIKALLCQSPVAEVVPGLLHEMRAMLGVHLGEYSLEEPGCRLVWIISFDYKAPWTYHYFVLSRIFGGYKLEPAGSYYLGPDWEAPAAWLNLTQEEVRDLVTQEELEVLSAIGVRMVRVGEADWVYGLQGALREAYQHPLLSRRASEPA
jgi:hypothetical protein